MIVGSDEPMNAELTQLIEAITHLAFYSGWPTAMSAIMVAKEVVAAREA